MAQRHPEDPLSSPTHTTDLLKSGFLSRRPNPYAAVLGTSTELSKNPNKPPDVEMKTSQVTSQVTSQPRPDTVIKPFATTSFANPFQAHGSGSGSPDTRTRSVTSASFIDMSTTSPMNQNAYFVTGPSKTDLDASKATLRRPQPVLFGAGGVVQPAIVQPPKKEPLKGIYAFFGSEELPVSPKQIPPSDMPQGLEAIPFIFKNQCYGPGLEVVDYFMKRTTNADEKMYFRIIKLIFITKLHMWDKMSLEFEPIGNLDKLIFDNSRQVYLPYHLRLFHALHPYFTSLSQTQSKSHSTSTPAKNQEDKALERLFNLLSFCEGFAKSAPYPQNELFEGEQTNIQSLCDTEVSEPTWVARIFRVCLIILEILFSKALVKLAHEFLGIALQKFPDNALLLTYQARLKMLQGEYSQANSIFEAVTANLPQDEYLEFIAINTFIQASHQLSFNESEALINDIIEKYPQYSTLATNNLFYILFAQCKIKEAIDTLEKMIRKEPWSVNEVIVANLLTAYDFYYVDSKERKKVINEIIDKYAIEFNKAAIAHELKA